MTPEPLLIGADIGTTSIKALAFEASGRAVARASCPTPTHRPRPDRAHHDPEELWASFARTLREVTDGLDDPRRVASVAVASFAEAAVPLDREGRPTHHAIAWFDGRSRPQAERLGRDLGADRIFAITGLSLQPIFGLCKLLWIKENEPDAFARTASWLNAADYVAFRLSGVRATDFSLATRTLALDLHRLEWADDLLDELDVPPSLFAPLRGGGSPLGTVTPEAAAATGLPEGVTVAAGGHDHVCGALAAGVTEPGTALDSIGTAEALFVPLERPLKDPEVGRQGYAQGAHVAGQYYALGGQYASGASVDWFRRSFGGGAGYEALISEAEKVPPGSLGTLFLPHLAGLASPPHGDPHSRGAFVGLSADAGRGALFRAVLEGLAFESRASLEPLLEHAGVSELLAVRAIGGGTQNRLLMRIKATVFGRAITVVGVEEAASLGAAILGGVGAGVYGDVPSALGELRYPETPVEPVAEEVPFYDAAFRRAYRGIYPSLRGLHHEIQDLDPER